MKEQKPIPNDNLLFNISNTYNKAVTLFMKWASKI